MDFPPYRTQVSPLTYIQRQRLLPVPGEVLVRAGERVDPQQIVAEAQLPGDFRILPVARLLGVPPAQMGRFLCVRVGERVEAGRVVAKRPGLNRRLIRSPIAGRVTAIAAGRLLIESEPQRFQLPAALSGEVIEVIDSSGVVIETRGALVQGVWGCGGEAWGVLRCLVDTPEEPLLAKSVDAACHGAILIGGSSLEERVLEQAADLHVRGIVVGGLPPTLLSHVSDLPFPIVVTEGIGVVPMAAPFFRLLATNAGREATISGRMRTRGGVIRPEVIVPLPAYPSSAAMPPISPFHVGMHVRVVCPPYWGATGTIVALPACPRPIETGALVRGAEVEIGRTAPVFVPLANLEALC